MLGQIEANIGDAADLSVVARKAVATPRRTRSRPARIPPRAARRAGDADGHATRRKTLPALGAPMRIWILTMSRIFIPPLLIFYYDFPIFLLEFDYIVPLTTLQSTHFGRCT